MRKGAVCRNKQRKASWAFVYFVFTQLYVSSLAVALPRLSRPGLARGCPFLVMELGQEEEWQRQKTDRKIRVFFFFFSFTGLMTIIMSGTHHFLHLFELMIKHRKWTEVCPWTLHWFNTFTTWYNAAVLHGRMTKEKKDSITQCGGHLFIFLARLE